MHCTRLILEGIIKIKDYLIKINNPVKTNKNARKYSVWHTANVLRGTQKLSCVEQRKGPAWNAGNALRGTQEMSCLQHRKSRVWNTGNVLYGGAPTEH